MSVDVSMRPGPRPRPERTPPLTIPHGATGGYVMEPLVSAERASRSSRATGSGRAGAMTLTRPTPQHTRTLAPPSQMLSFQLVPETDVPTTTTNNTGRHLLLTAYSDSAMFCGPCTPPANSPPAAVPRAQPIRRPRPPPATATLEENSNVDDDDDDETDEENGETRRLVTVSHWNEDPNEISIPEKMASSSSLPSPWRTRLTATETPTTTITPPDVSHLMVRSTFVVQGICCATEVPSIRRIIFQCDRLPPGDGTSATPCIATPVIAAHNHCQSPTNQETMTYTVSSLASFVSYLFSSFTSSTTSDARAQLPVKSVGGDSPKVIQSIQINIATKRVYVHHDSQQLSATFIAQTLSEQGFPAQLIHDGGRALRQPTSSTLSSGALRRTTLRYSPSTILPLSSLHVDSSTTFSVPNAGSSTPLSSIDDHHTIRRVQSRLLAQRGIRKVHVNAGDAVLDIDHDAHLISAAKLSDLLRPEYDSSIVVDWDGRQNNLAQTCHSDNTISPDIVSPPKLAWADSLFDHPLPLSLYVESAVTLANLPNTAHGVRRLPHVLRQHYDSTQIRAVHPDSHSLTCKVEHNPDQVSIQSICSTLEQHGFQPTVLTDGAVEGFALPLIDDELPPQDNKTNCNVSGFSSTGRDFSLWDLRQQVYNSVTSWHISQLRWTVVLSGIFWMLAVLGTVGGWESLELCGLLAVAFGIPQVALKALRTIRRYEFDSNCMMVVAAIGAVILGEYEEAASVSFLFAVSEYLESLASDRARLALSDIVNLRPDYAHVIHPVTHETLMVPATRVPVGALISVRTGDKVVADGVVMEGSTTVDESSLTGESVPIRKAIHDVVSGGSTNVGSTRLVVRTTSTVEDSAVSRLIRLVEEAQAHRSHTEKMIDGFARAYTPVVLLIASILCSFPWLWGIEEGRYWTLNGLILIVVACPCALTISTPVTYAAGLASTAQHGIVVKSGASLEAMGSVETVILDKTGTLTQGKFHVVHLEMMGRASEFQLRLKMLRLLAIMEEPSSHPLAQALVKQARAEGVSFPLNAVVKQHCILKGEGIQANVDGLNVYVGNRKLFHRLGMYQFLTPDQQLMAQKWSIEEGGTVGFIGVEGMGIIGAYSVMDPVRPEAYEVVSALRSSGIRIIMLTGDAAGPAYAAASRVGIKDTYVHSQLTPEDKLHFVGSLQSPAPKYSFGLFRLQPKVLFCGDGVNDAPAIAIADVGVSMGEGAALAMEMSDVTLMDSNLQKLLFAIQMGARVILTVQENIVLSLFCKLAVVVLTFCGYMTLMYAIASDVGVMLIVTLNGMKLLTGDTGDVLKLRKQRFWCNIPQRIDGVVSLQNGPKSFSLTESEQISVDLVEKIEASIY